MSIRGAGDVIYREIKNLSRQVLDMLLNMMDGDSGSIMLLDSIEKVLRITSYRGISPEVEEVKESLGEGIAGYALKNRMSLILNSGDTFLGRPLTRDDIGSSIVLPIIDGESRIGVININRSPGKVAFSIEDLETATIFGRYFTALMKGVLAFHRNLQATKLARAQYRILRNISKYKNINCMMKSLLQSLVKFTRASFGAIGIYEGDIIRTTYTFPNEILLDLREEINDLFSMVLEDKKEISIENSIAFPLLYKEELFGATYLRFDSGLPEPREIKKLKVLLRDVTLVIRNLSNYLSIKETIRQEERKRITNILHDRICQGVTEGIIRVECIKKLKVPKNILSEIDELESLLKNVLNDVRCIIYEEKPIALEEGLFENLRRYIEGVEKRSSITFNLTLSGDESIVPKRIKEILFFVVREAIVNIRRHSMADNAYIECNVEENGVSIKIEDDGIGFDYEKYKDTSNSFGIKIMEDRIISLDGIFKIEGFPHKGTRIEIYVPL